MENLNEYASLIFGLLLLLIVVVELIIYLTWNKQYFRFGIPVFARTISVNDTILVPLRVKDMEAHCPSSFWGPTIEFREIGPGEYAFREGVYQGIFYFFRLAYPPAIRGYLVYDRNQKQIRVLGYVLIYPFVIFSASIYFLGVGLALFLLSVYFGIPYLIQAARYNAVAKIVAGLCTAKAASKINAG